MKRSWLVVLLMGLAAPSFAQTSDAPPRVFRAIDDNGVDVSSGELNIADAQVSVGPPGEGLQRSFLNRGSRDNLTGTLSCSVEDSGGLSTTVCTVTLGDSAVQFQRQGASTTFVDRFGADGATLVDNVYTARDGTVATFSGTSITGRRLSTLVRPSGETLSYTYSGCGTSCERLDAVVSSLGYMIKYEYVAPGSRVLARVQAINLAFEACTPSAASCATSQPWSQATFSGQPGIGTYSVTDSAGRVTSYTYTGNYLTNIQRPGRAPISIGYVSGRIAWITNGVGTWHYSYVSSYPDEVTYPDGLLTTTITDPANNQVTVVTNMTTERVVSVTDARGKTTQYQSSATGRLKRVTAPEGNYVAYTYDSRGNVTESRWVSKTPGSPVDVVVRANFDTTCSNPKTCNQPNYVIDERGYRTDFTYHAPSGSIATATAPAVQGIQAQVRYTYSSLHPWWYSSPGVLEQGGTVYRLTGVSQCQTTAACQGTADEVKTTYVYGSPGAPNNLQLTSVIHASGTGALSRTISISYDLRGDPTSIDGPLPGTADTAYRRWDVLRRPVGAIAVDPDGPWTGRPARAVRYLYAANGQMSEVQAGTVAGPTDVDWAAFSVTHRVVHDYDTLGQERQTTWLGSDGAAYKVAQYSYDAAGRPQCTALRMNPLAYAALPASACVQGAASELYGPDRISQQLYQSGLPYKVQDAVGTTLQRDRTTYAYTDNGLISSVSDANGNTTSYTYDGFDRVSVATYPAGAGGITTEVTTYDGASNVATFKLRDGQSVSYGYDALGRLTSMTLPGLSYSYGYDALSRPTTATLAGQTLTRQYDAFSRLINDISSLGTVHYDYDLADRRTRLRWPDGFFVDYDYTTAGELTAQRENGATSGAGVLTGFTYDALGRRQSLRRGNGVTTAYAYDSASRLASLTQDPAGTTYDQTVSFSYTPASEVRRRTSSNAAYAWNGRTSVTLNSNVNALNQLASVGARSLAYDLRGNLLSDGLSDYGYNAADQLTRVATAGSPTARMTLDYDAYGRLAQTTAAATTQYLYDGADLIAEYRGGVLQQRYVHGPGVDEPLVQYQSGTRQWLLADAQGSILGATDSAGALTALNRYDEYGIPDPGNAGRFQYTGQQWLAEAGVYHYKARAYAPALGRFLQTDPLGYGAGMNLYAYVGNNPVNATDPSGMISPADGASGGASCDAFGCTPTPLSTITDARLLSPGRSGPVRSIGGNSTVDGTGHVSGYLCSRAGYCQPQRPATPVEAMRDTLILAAIVGGPVLFADPLFASLFAVGSAPMAISDGMPLGSGYVRVGRWMSEAEHNAMVATGRVQESTLNGVTSVSSPPNPSAWIRQTTAPRYVEFDVPAGAVRPSLSSNAKIYGPSSIFGPKLGITDMPPALNITWTACRVPMTCAVGVGQ